MSALVEGMSDVDYHRDPSLSVSGAKKLLPPSCPAKFRHEQLHGQGHKSVWDFGKAAHGLVLGNGAPVVVVDAPNWMSKAAKEQRETARAAGHTPVLASEWQQIEGMAAAIQSHPIASELFNPANGRPEVSAFWTDEGHGVDRRARFDWLPETDGGRLVIPDYKTAQSAEPNAFAKSAANFGYHMQAAWYTDAAYALDLAEDVSFVFVAQEKVAPYLVTVCELDVVALQHGGALNDQALRIYRECLDTDVWPSYSDEIELIGLPAWATYDAEMELSA